MYVQFRLLALRRLIQSQKIRIAKQKDLINQAKEQVSQLKDYKWYLLYFVSVRKTNPLITSFKGDLLFEKREQGTSVQTKPIT